MSTSEHAWIETIDPREATGATAEAYAPFFDPKSGYMDNILKVHGLRPEGLKAHWAVYSTAMEGTDTLPRVDREIVAVVVSGINGCHYWLDHHRRGLRRLLEDDALAAAIEADWTTAGLDARRTAMLRYASKLTATPGAMTRDDVDALRAAGLSDADVLGLVEVTAYYAYANRIADGLGIAVEPDRPPHPDDPHPDDPPGGVPQGDGAPTEGWTADLDHGHSPEEIRARLDAGPDHSYLRDWVYGGIDGAVTTFAIVASVAGARLSAGIVLVLGVANLVADGFSMAAANFSGTRAEREQFLHAKALEEKQVEEEPEGEREELRQIYQRKGFRGEELERMVAVISSDRDQWVRTMLTEEYGLPLEVRSPLKAAGSTMASFVLAGAVPLVPYALGLDGAFTISCAATGVVFFVIGAARRKWSLRSWPLLGAETLAIGGAAATLAYLAGALLKGLVEV